MTRPDRAGVWEYHYQDGEVGEVEIQLLSEDWGLCVVGPPEEVQNVSGLGFATVEDFCDHIDEEDNPVLWKLLEEAKEEE